MRLRALTGVVAVAAAGSIGLAPPALAGGGRPAVTSVSPAVGLAVGGARVAVHGQNLYRVTKISFGTKAGTALHVVSSRTVWVTAPAHARGTSTCARPRSRASARSSPATASSTGISRTACAR